MSKVALGGPADDNSNDPILQVYQRHVKRSIADGRKPLDENTWFSLMEVIEGLKTPTKAGLEIKPIISEPVPAKKKQSVDEDVVRAKFVAMMISEGYVTPMDLFQRVRHGIALGDERPRTKKQVAPCPLCGNLFCAWAPAAKEAA
jgi:hypothetical protein